MQFTDKLDLDVELIEFVEQLETHELLAIPGVYKALVKYYTDMLAEDAVSSRSARHNPPSIVRTVQDERDWEKAKKYYARSAKRTESRWTSPDWATVMVIFKNIKGKRHDI